jgi:hypothetical protein
MPGLWVGAGDLFLVSVVIAAETGDKSRGGRGGCPGCPGMWLRQAENNQAKGIRARTWCAEFATGIP